MMKRHVDLKVFSRYTKGETVMRPEEVTYFAKRNWAPAIALTDFNSVRGYYEFYNAAKEDGIKPIFGLGTYCLFDIGKKKAITLLAKSQEGLKNIYKLVSISQMRKEELDNEPYLTMDEIEKHREGIIVGMELSWDVIYDLCANLEEALESGGQISAEHYYNALFGEYLCCVDYVEISPWEHREYCAGEAKEVNDEKLKQVAHNMVSYLQEKGKYPVAATGGNCYGDFHDVCFEVLHSGETVTKRPMSYLKCTEHVLEEYEFLGKELAEKVVLDNTSYIADMVEEVTLPDKHKEKHRFEMPCAEELFLKKCHKAVLNKYGYHPPKLILERITDEIKKIHYGKWESLFIIAAETTNRCRELGDISSFHGPLGSSFIAYLLDITGTNPLPPHYYCPSCRYIEFVDEEEYYSGYDLIGYGKEKIACPKCGAILQGDGHNIPCETLFGFDGEKTIAFEFKFSDEYVGQLSPYLKKMVGEDRVYNLPAGEKMLGRLKATEMVDTYCQKAGANWDDWLKEEVIGIISSILDDEKKQDLSHKWMCNWMYFVPKDKDIHDYAPIGYRRISGALNDEPVIIQVNPFEQAMERFILVDSQWLSELVLMEKYSGVSAQSIDWSEVDFSKLFLDDRETEEPFSKSIAWMLKKAPLTSFADLVKHLGKSHRTTLKDSNEMGEDDISKDIITAREDVMFALKRYGLTDAAAFEIAEVVRKGKAVNGFSDEHMKLLKDVPDWYIESMKNIRYLFPKAHIVEEASLCAQMAWYRMNYPKAYEQATGQISNVELHS